MSGDIELNPGPKPNLCKSFSISFCQQNLNSITSPNFTKDSFLTAFNTIHKFDIICLNSETLSNGKNLNVPGYKFIRADHPSNIKRGGFCIYFKESLPLRLHNISHLNECICFKILISNKLCNFISIT